MSRLGQRDGFGLQGSLEVEQGLDETHVGLYVRPLFFQEVVSLLEANPVGCHQESQHHSGTPRHPCIAMHQNIGPAGLLGDELDRWQKDGSDVCFA